MAPMLDETWRCSGCGHVGPETQFERKDDQGKLQHVCPSSECSEPLRVYSLLDEYYDPDD